MNCGKELKYKQTKFCSRSCSASYNNKYRKITDETRRKLSQRSFKNALKRNLKIRNKEYIKEHRDNLTEEQIYNVKTAREEKNKTQVHICLNCGKEFKTHSTKSKYCCQRCSTEHIKKQSIEKFKNNEFCTIKNADKLPESVRQYLYEQADYKCQICGFEGYNKKTQKTILQIHHIDGDSSNNTEGNLQVICPNCHAMTENYMALNKGKSARINRYKKDKI